MAWPGCKPTTCALTTPCTSLSLAYLTNLVRTVTAACSRSGLRSTSSSNFALPQLRPRFCERSSSHAGPSAWNALPSDICAVRDMKAFRQAVKTHYFSLAFSVFQCFFYYFICILFTIGMHLCSNCNRRTTNVRYNMWYTVWVKTIPPAVFWHFSQTIGNF